MCACVCVKSKEKNDKRERKSRNVSSNQSRIMALFKVLQEILGKFVFLFWLDLITNKTFLIPPSFIFISVLSLPVPHRFADFALPAFYSFSLPWLINQISLLVPEHLHLA